MCPIPQRTCHKTQVSKPPMVVRPGVSVGGPIVYLQCRCGGLRVRSQLKISRGGRTAAGQETEGGVCTHLRIVFIAVLPRAHEQRLVAFRIPPLARQLFRYGRVYRQGTVNHVANFQFWLLRVKHPSQLRVFQHLVTTLMLSLFLFRPMGWQELRDYCWWWAEYKKHFKQIFQFIKNGYNF